MSWYIFTFTLLVDTELSAPRSVAQLGPILLLTRLLQAQRPARQMFFHLRLGSPSPGALPCRWGSGLVHVREECAVALGRWGAGSANLAVCRDVFACELPWKH